LSKRLLRCHRPASSCGRQAPPGSTGNDEEPASIALLYNKQFLLIKLRGILILLFI
jgi:hypothetical protein